MAFPLMDFPDDLQEEVLLRVDPRTLLRSGVLVSRKWATWIRSSAFWRRLAEAQSQGFPPEVLLVVDRFTWREAAELVLVKPFRGNLLAFDPEPWFRWDDWTSCVAHKFEPRYLLGLCLPKVSCGDSDEWESFFESLRSQNLSDEEMLQKVNESFPAMEDSIHWRDEHGHCTENSEAAYMEFCKIHETCSKLLPFVDLQLVFKEFVRATDVNPTFNCAFSTSQINRIKLQLTKADFEGQKWRLATLGPVDLQNVPSSPAFPIHSGGGYEILGTHIYLIVKKQ